MKNRIVLKVDCMVIRVLECSIERLVGPGD